jgi:ClpP class serine protease
VTDLCCSAGYYLASQAGTIYADQHSWSGCIGAYMVLLDSAAAFAQQGLKPHLIASGRHKGLPQPGVKIEQHTLDEARRMLDQVSGFFFAAVKSGRRFSDAQLAAVNDGRTWIAADALKLRLIDGVQSFDVTHAQLASDGVRVTLTAEQLQARAQIEQLQAGQKLHATPVPAGQAAAGKTSKGQPMFPSAKNEFEARLAEAMAANPRLDRGQAARQVLLDDEDLRQRYVAEHNEEFREKCYPGGRRR